jgi:hypothetical protein
VLWDYAGTLQMLERTNEAVVAYTKLTRRGIRRIAFGDCGEGLTWARSLVADSWYRLSQCYRRLSRRREALWALRRHLTFRGPGCRSLYSLREVRATLSDLEKDVSRTEYQTRALCVQLQPERSRENTDEALRRLGALPEFKYVNEGVDREEYINIGFETIAPAALWTKIRACLKAAKFLDGAIVCCEGKWGWDDYLLLHHFDSKEPLDRPPVVCQK